jgi:hypothetical protein
MTSTIKHLTILTLLAALFAGCGSTHQITPKPVTNELQIDGNLSDWNTSEAVFESRDQANYYAAFDDEFLYLFIEVRSPQKDMAIRRSGLTVYLSDDRDNRKQIGVGFPPGTFNMLRDYPNAFREFTRDGEWMSKPANRELLESLNEELFERVMIVERQEGSSDPSYGFIDPSQLEVDGMLVAVNRDSRYIGLEMRIPRDGSSLYRFSGDEVWVGFAIEPPDFRIRDNSDYSATSNRRDAYGNRSRQRSQPRQNISRNLGSMERWYKINFQSP